MSNVIFRVRTTIMIVALLVLASCAGGPANLIGINGIDQSYVKASGATVQNLFIATSRSRSKNLAEFYNGERSQAISLANLDVTIPKDHVTGAIEQPRTGKLDVAKHFTIGRPLLFDDSAAFKASVNKALSERAAGDRSVLVFVHGYNTNFSAAVLRLAQFVNDTGFKGVPVLFTWASRGQALEYVYDINSALQARIYLTQLASVLATTNAESFSVVAHSMGNLVTLEVLSEMVQNNVITNAPLSSVILAAPDIDLDLFKQYIKDLAPIKDKIYVMVSKDDRALTVSGRLAGNVSRAGAADPRQLAALGLNVIDLSLVKDKSNTNHSKFAESPEIVRIIGGGLNSGSTLSTAKKGSTDQAFKLLFGGIGQVAVGLGSVVTPGL